MFGWCVATFGGPEVMQWVEMPELVPGPGQLRVAVKASGINFAETRMRSGAYIGQALPFVMGMESAGIVEAVGPGVTSVAVGDRVFGRARGSHATHVLFDEVHTLRLPDSLSFVEGAAIPVGWLTAWHALVTVARSRAGEKVLIEAIASSVGSAALQIAKAAGLPALQVVTINAHVVSPQAPMPPTTTKPVIFRSSYAVIRMGTA